MTEPGTYDHQILQALQQIAKELKQISFALQSLPTDLKQIAQSRR
jgi:hypothetical protein